MASESLTAPTNVPGLDLILGGGLPRRGIVFVVGAPGTGKTVLAQQIAFATARADRPVLYFSGLAEPHERLVEHLRPFEFFDERLLGDGVQLLSLNAFAEQGAEATVASVMQTARQVRPGLIVVDGFRGLSSQLADERGVASLPYRLGAQVGLLGALLIVVLEGNPRAEESYPELASSDVLVGMFYERARTGHRRYLEVFKRRGAPHLPGLHAVSIGQAGVTCYPQFEVTLSPSDEPIDPADRAAFGLPELDAMLRGGPTRRTTTIVAGNLGMGKTALGLSFLAEGAAGGEPGLLLGFRESRQQILIRGGQIHPDFGRLVDDGTIQLLLQPPIMLDPDILAQRLQETITEGGVRRLVVDSVAEVASAVWRERLYNYLAALVTMLRGRGVTSLLTLEIADLLGADVRFSEVPMSTLGDNVLLLRHRESLGELRRVANVVKMRFSDHDSTLREYTIEAGGLRLLRQVGPDLSGPASGGTNLLVPWSSEL